jgi:hypothetical protein
MHTHKRVGRVGEATAQLGELLARGGSRPQLPPPSHSQTRTRHRTLLYTYRHLT